MTWIQPLDSFFRCIFARLQIPREFCSPRNLKLFLRTCHSLKCFCDSLVTAPIIANETIIEMDNPTSEAARNPQITQSTIAEAGPSSVGDARGEASQPQQPVASHADLPATMDLSGETTLHHAAKGGDLESVRNLIHAHANVANRDNDGLLAAQIACIWSHWDIMEYLFNVDEDKTLINKAMLGGEFLGSTCLHVAVKRNAWKAVRYLAANMELGALLYRDNDGLTGWDLACRGSTSPISPSARATLSRARYPKKQLPFGGGPASSIARSTTSLVVAHSTESIQNTSQRLSYYPSFPVNLEASCILLAGDSQINQAIFRPLSWQEREISGVNCWLLSKNHVGMHCYEPRLYLLTNSS